jgi:ubiquinone/menaquinone biosynthesis C-methylase UbiE
MNAVRLKITLDILKRHQPGRLLDAGCGGGATTTAVMDAGWDAQAIDYAENMVAETNAHLAEKGITDRQARQASVTDLSMFSDGEFDALICLGVMYYIEDEEQAYREFCRVLKPGGILLVSMQNELFDMFTFNRYTRRFFKRHFFPLIDGGNDGRADELDQLLAGLITNPDAPTSHDSGSARDAVFTRQDTPFTYPSKLEKVGFETLSGPYYHGIHLAPPLLESKDEKLALESRDKQYTLAEDWRGMFNAAHFMFEFRKHA